MPMLVGVLSDTHGPRFWKECPIPVARELESVDLILHAGDVCEPYVLDQLSTFAPVSVVLGNNDGQSVAHWGATETLEIDLAGVRVGMIHDSGPRAGRYGRMRRRFPHCRLVVYGHSHVPLLDEGDDTFMLVNPGSPTDKRAQPHKTMALLDLADAEVRGVRLITVDD